MIFSSRHILSSCSSVPISLSLYHLFISLPPFPGGWGGGGVIVCLIMRGLYLNVNGLRAEISRLINYVWTGIANLCVDSCVWITAKPLARKMVAKFCYFKILQFLLQGTIPRFRIECFGRPLNDLKDRKEVRVAVFWIRIGSWFNQVSGSGFGFRIRIRIQEGKNDPQKYKNAGFGSETLTCIVPGACSY